MLIPLHLTIRAIGKLKNTDYRYHIYYIIIYGFSRDFDPFILNTLYTACNSNHDTCIFQTVNTMDVIFATLHTTLFLYVKMYLVSYNADIMTSKGSKLPHLQVGAFKLFQIRVYC